AGLRGHAGGDGEPVVVSDLLGHGRRLVGVEQLERAGEQRGEQVVAAGRGNQRRGELPRAGAPPGAAPPPPSGGRRGGGTPRRGALPACAAPPRLPTPTAP